MFHNALFIRKFQILLLLFLYSFVIWWGEYVTKYGTGLRADCVVAVNHKYYWLYRNASILLQSVMMSIHNLFSESQLFAVRFVYVSILHFLVAIVKDVGFFF